MQVVAEVAWFALIVIGLIAGWLVADVIQRALPFDTNGGDES